MDAKKTARVEIFSLGLFLSLAIVLSTYLVTSTISDLKLRKGTITVKGYAEREITSDYITWRGNIFVRHQDLVQAYEKLENDMTRVFDYLEKQKEIDPSEIKTSPVYTSTLHKHSAQGGPTNEIEAYALNQEFQIISRDISKVAQIASEITHLIKEGIEVASYSPQYFYSKLHELKIEMLGEAAKDAKIRASSLASNSGAHVGKLRSAHQGVFQITPLFSTAISDYGENDTTSVEKKIKAIATMEYLLE